MATNVPSSFEDYRNCVAEHVEGSAGWRDSINERFPGDLRNVHAAAALREAARLVRPLSPGDSKALRKLHRFGAELVGERDPWVVIRTPESLGRFGFDREPWDIGLAEIEGLLMDIYHCTMEAYRAIIEDNADHGFADEVVAYIRGEVPSVELVPPDGIRWITRPRGHFGSHLRETFVGWVDGGQPDEAKLDVDYEEEVWPVGRFLDYFLGCTDILPESTCDDLQIPRGSTYGQAAREELARRASGGQWVYVYEDDAGHLAWDEEFGSN
jgi:hypothetical protein